MWYWGKDGQIDHWNRVESLETDPCLCENLIDDRDGIAGGSGKSGYPYKIMKLNPSGSNTKMYKEKHDNFRNKYRKLPLSIFWLRTFFFPLTKITTLKKKGLTNLATLELKNWIC